MSYLVHNALGRQHSEVQLRKQDRDWELQHERRLRERRKPRTKTKIDNLLSLLESTAISIVISSRMKSEPFVFRLRYKTNNLFCLNHCTISSNFRVIEHEMHCGGAFNWRSWNFQWMDANLACQKPIKVILMPWRKLIDICKHLF